MLVIDISGYLLGVAMSIGGASSNLALERLAAVPGLAVVIGLSGSLDGLWVLIAVDVLLLVILVVEHYRVEVADRLIPVASKRS